MQYQAGILGARARILALSALTCIGVVAALAGCGDDTSANDASSAVCSAGQQQCGAGCVDVRSSAQHCGACGVACAPGQVCQAGVCQNVCGPQQGFCGGQCVSLQSTAHCGACGNACMPGQFCVGGACSATCTGTVCPGPTGNECVSLVDDRNHCGACNDACGPNQTCRGGQCVLDCGMQTACAGACVDVMSDAANCGACGNACGSGQTCMQGACMCQGGLQACGDACVDTASNPEHCGACDEACGVGSACEAGSCVGADGCTDTPVADLELSAVDVYQTVQIPIMEEGTAISSGMRNADVVAGRETVFTIHVTPDAAWSPREVSARVELADVESPERDQRQMFYDQLTPTGATTDADPGSTFQVEVPADAVGTDTRYAVTLVECDGAASSPNMTPAGARFPGTGYEPLDALETGPLKVHIIPVGNPGPDTSEEGMRAFEERLEAVFPITEVEFTVGEPLQASASSMCTLLGAISTRRSQDRPAPDVYYYGLTNGILGRQSGCSNASRSASGSKVSVGWAQGYTPDDGTTGAATMCHELGHAHGRVHAPCRVQDPDPRYPYPNADIGVWGYDNRSDEFYEPTSKDMMSYCPEPRWAAWISDYNYQAILERAIAVNALAETPVRYERSAEPVVAWRLLVSDSTGVHWIDDPLMVQGTPEGTPVDAVVHGAQGETWQVRAYKQDLHDGVSHDAFMLTLPEPDEAWRSVEVPGLLAPQPLPSGAAR